RKNALRSSAKTSASLAVNNHADDAQSGPDDSIFAGHDTDEFTSRIRPNDKTRPITQGSFGNKNRLVQHSLAYGNAVAGDRALAQRKEPAGGDHRFTGSRSRAATNR